MDKIREDMVASMKAKDEVKLQTLRSIIAAVQEAEVAGNAAKTLTDAEVEKVIANQAKRRVEAAEAFDEGGATDRAAAERAELVVLESYLPEGLSDAEVDAIVTETLAAEGLSEKAQMGQAMKAVNAKIAGRADGRMVADLVKSKLA